MTTQLPAVQPRALPPTPSSPGCTMSRRPCDTSTARVSPTRSTVWTPQKLIRWIRNGVASPNLKRLPANRMVITFEDLVSLRVIAALRAANVNFRAIYSAEEWLRRKTDAQPSVRHGDRLDRGLRHLHRAARAPHLSQQVRAARHGRDARIPRSRPRPHVQEPPCLDMGAVRRRSFSIRWCSSVPRA